MDDSIIAIYDPANANMLVNVRLVNQKVVAEYNPDDLDRAAQVFFEFLTGYLNTRVFTGTGEDRGSIQK